MAAITIDLEVQVQCERCGADLTADANDPYGEHQVTVEPCEICLGKARDAGYTNGYEEAERDAAAG